MQWAAFDGVAMDINAFITDGAPTNDLVRSDAVPAVSTLIVEPGKAVVEKIGG